MIPCQADECDGKAVFRTALLATQSEHIGRVHETVNGPAKREKIVPAVLPSTLKNAYNAGLTPAGAGFRLSRQIYPWNQSVSVSDSRPHKMSQHDAISVMAPARLHLGFVDLNGAGGRHFGSLGLGIEDLGIKLSARPHDSVEVSGPAAARAADYARQLLAHHGIEQGVQLTIEHTIPEHAGLGSGTQMALAVGVAVARLYDLPAAPEQIAAILDRGSRSGIGIGSFSHGGFIVDAGRGEHTLVPPVVSRLHFPEAWRLVLMFDPDCAGLSGPPERAAFENLPPMQPAVADHISWLVLMQVLPAVAEADCSRFGDGISRIQQYIGDYFAPVQGGIFYSDRVAAAAEQLRAAGATGIGQSSWGPTGFAVFPSETQAHQALRTLREADRLPGGLDIRICRGRNVPAEIQPDASAASRRLQGL